MASSRGTHTSDLSKRQQMSIGVAQSEWLEIHVLVITTSVPGQSRRMRPACFSSECPLLPGSDS